jgi:hypothetical protein
VRFRTASAILFLAAPLAASAQRGPQLEVTVLKANSPPAGATVRASRLLSDSRTRELLINGFPAALSFRLELWREGNLFDELEAMTSWNVLVRYDPYSQQYQLVRRGNRDTEAVSGFATIASVEEVLSQSQPVALTPRRTGRPYYYNVVLDIETLSVSDLDELQRWLRGELEPAVRGKRAPLSALRRGFGTLLSRVLGGENRHYEARSGTFRP